MYFKRLTLKKYKFIVNSAIENPNPYDLNFSIVTDLLTKMENSMRKILLAGASVAVLLAASNALAAAEEPISEGNLVLTSDDTVTYNESYNNFNFNGQDGNTGINSVDGTSGTVTFAEGFESGTLNSTGVYGQDGIIQVSKINIDAGTISAANQGAMINGMDGITMTGGEVNLTDQAHMVVGYMGDNSTQTKMELKGGNVNLTDGGIIRAASKNGVEVPEKGDFSSVEFSGATVTVSGEENYIASRETNLTAGSMTVKDGTLNLVGDGEAVKDGYIKFGSEVSLEKEGAFNISGGEFTLDNATVNANNVDLAISGGKTEFNNTNVINGDLNITGGEVVNKGNLTLNGKTSIAGTTLETGSALGGETSTLVFNDAEVTAGGILAGDYMTVNGKVNVEGSKNEGNWRDGSDLVADRNMTITENAEVTVGDKGILTVGYNAGETTATQKMDINGGKVTVNSGGIVFAASDAEGENISAVNLNGGELNLNDGSTLISAETNINGGTMTLAGAVKLLKNSKVEGFDGAPEATAFAAEDNGAFNINGGKVVLGENVDITNTNVDINVNGGSLDVEKDAAVSGGLNLSGGTINNKAALTADVNQTAGTFNALENSSVSKITQSGGETNLAANSAITELKMTGGSLNVNGDAEVTTAQVDKGIVNLGTNKLTSELTMGTDAILNVDVNNDAAGQIVGSLTGTETEGKTTRVNLNIANGTDISDGIQLATDSASNVELASNIMYKDLEINAEGKVTGEKSTSSDIASALEEKGVSSQSANVLGAFAYGGTGTVIGDAIADAMAADIQSVNGSGIAYAAAQAENLAPMAASAAVDVSTQNTTQIMNIVDSQLNNFGAVEGKSSGDVFNRVTTWVKGLFNRAELDRTSRQAGYKADTEGVAMGIDKQVTDEAKVGLGYAYSTTDLKKNVKKTDIDTHTAVLYGQYKPSDVYFNGIAAYGWSDYDAKTSAYGYGVNGKYDVNTFGVQAMAGYDFGKFAPEIGLRYFNVKQDGYTDTAGQRVGKNNSDVLTAVLAAKYQDNICLENGMVLKPSARLAATYDLTGDKANSVVSLANGSGYIVDGERLDKFGIEVGAGLSAEVSDNVEFGLSYEGKFRDHYTDNTGMLEAKYKF